MPLADFQVALGTMVAAYSSANSLSATTAFQNLTLSENEEVWLSSLRTAPGFKVTCAIQQWWRETRLRDLARLTIVALGKERAAKLIGDYLKTNVCTSLFFLPETMAFLNYVATQTDHPHLIALAQFEQALLLAKEQSVQSVLIRDLTVRYIEFAAPPEEILAAVLRGQPLPEPRAERFPVLVSAGFPHFWRLATSTEVRQTSVCRSPTITSRTTN